MINHLNKIIGLKNKKNTGITHLSTVLNLKSINSTPPTPPASGTPIKMIGGKTVKFNQKIDHGNFDATTGWLTNYCTLTVDNNCGIAKAGSTVNDRMAIQAPSMTIIQNHKYYYSVQAYQSDKNIQLRIKIDSNYNLSDVYSIPAGAYLKMSGINTFTGSSSASARVNYRFNYNKVLATGDLVYFKRAMLIDLTVMFGSGNEPSTAEAVEAMFPNDYYDYCPVALLSGKCDKVISYDDQSTQIGEYLIPAEIQALSGYGLSTRSLYNYVDFENKKFVKNVDIRAYQSGDESDSTVVTDGTNTIYPITPVETDISSYISTIPTIETAEGGSIVLHQQSDTKLDIPYTISDE